MYFKRTLQKKNNFSGCHASNQVILRMEKQKIKTFRRLIRCIVVKFIAKIIT